MDTTAAIRPLSPDALAVKVARAAAARRARVVTTALLPALLILTLAVLALARFGPASAVANTCFPPFDQCLPPASEFAVMLRVVVGLALGTALACALAALRCWRLARDDELALGLTPDELGSGAWWRRAPPEPLYLRLR
ncbi:MAG: hypothetical protein A2138_00650 [Deltaproteobacteria bacterium RBG_16_71_12]|nr:MAG: hypothetical protein A2138_00650 [Deltaproteobacteria bacterium RBG_16_71_12]